jgi:hypothetical protein
MSYQLTAMSLIALAITNCSGGKMDTTNKVAFPTIKDVPAEAWQKLSQKKIYFGHQSVGQNIIDGINDVMKQNTQIKLTIVDLCKVTDFNKPFFAHSSIGKNEDPRAKCEDFDDVIDKKIAGKVDIAFFKFCYVDIMPASDVSRLFESYRSTLASLKEKYPKVVFIHITSSLTSLQTGPKAWIKKVIGRSIDGFDDNIKREQFNAMLLKEYEGKDAIFDLAKIESTTPDGSSSVFEKDGKTYPRMVPEYTNDGGHLNELGRKVVAEQFLILLASLANK